MQRILAYPDSAAAPPSAVTVRHIVPWRWQHHMLGIATETIGEGRSVLMLPSFSTISTMDEMRPLARRLAACGYACTLIDWPGFGASTRARLRYSPALYHACLAHLADRLLPMTSASAILAAGHAAGYALACMADRPWMDKLVLIAPTWRGPMPTMGARPLLRAGVRMLIHASGIGQALYRLNTHQRIIAAMLRRHVFEGSVTEALVASKQAVARQPGARFASAAFVSGALDPVLDRTCYQELFDRFTGKTLVICGDSTPPKSRAEMQAIEPTARRTVLWSRGALALHEEHAALISPDIAAFLA